LQEFSEKFKTTSGKFQKPTDCWSYFRIFHNSIGQQDRRATFLHLSYNLHFRTRPTTIANKLPHRTLSQTISPHKKGPKIIHSTKIAALSGRKQQKNPVQLFTCSFVLCFFPIQKQKSFDSLRLIRSGDDTTTTASTFDMLCQLSDVRSAVNTE
jgi:hypothetical protein